jgi:hypothetical protein
MAVQRLSLTRDQFASFLQDFEQIKQFERLFSTVDTINTETLDEINVSAGSAFAAANEALAQISGLSIQTELLAFAPPDLGGTVTSVGLSGGTTGLTVSGTNPITTSGTFTLGGTLVVANGGTGQTTYTNGQLLIGNTTGNTLAKATLTAGTNISITNGAGTITINATDAFVGTVTSVSVVSANGLAGTVANATTTPAITLSTSVTGIVKGNGTALSAASAGTDYVAPGAYTASGLTMATARILGRTTASTGAAEEISVGTGLTLATGSLINAAPDQVVSLTGAGTTSISGTYPSFTITSNDAFVGTVTSVGGTGTVNGITLTGTVTSSGSLTLGGTLSGVSLTTQVSGTLPIANGGTNGTAAPTAGGVAYGTGTAYAVNSAGTSGQVLTSAGAGAPTWTTPTTGTVTSVTGTAPVVSSGGATPAISMAAATASVNGYLTSTDWTTFNNKGSGTVTSVGGTGTVNGITLTGTVTSSGSLTLGGTLSGVSLTTQVSGTLPVANGGTGVTTSTGTVAVVLSTSPTLVTPILGVASATSIATGLGAVGTPAYTFTGNTNTGMWSPATGNIAISNNGVETVRIGSSGNVGIGTSSPGSFGLLALVKNATGVTTGAVSNSNTTANDGAKFASFYSTTEMSSIGHYWDGGSFIGKVFSYGDLTFLLGSGTPVERMRIGNAGAVGIGTTANASALLDVQSTTKGVRMPNMTTTQKNAISSPAAGLMVFDTTLAKLCVYSGTAWQTVTSI